MTHWYQVYADGEYWGEARERSAAIEIAVIAMKNLCDRIEIRCREGDTQAQSSKTAPISPEGDAGDLGALFG